MSAKSHPYFQTAAEEQHEDAREELDREVELYLRERRTRRLNPGRILEAIHDRGELWFD
jgi:hypothetical protein